MLLPGMDGTGNLFDPLLDALSGFDCEVIALPESGSQDYLSITKYVKEKLPKSDFILVAESFSGPVASRLAKEDIKNMRGIIFVATFLSAPSRLLIPIAKALPLKLLSSLPFAELFHKYLFLGPSASNDLVQLFQSTVRSLTSNLIKARLSSMQSLVCSLEPIELPVAYIQAASDKLVSAHKAIEFSRHFKNIIIKTIDGPHFILQAQPVQCAVVINELVPLLTKIGTGKPTAPSAP
ncbi:alpha/beta hydrolase [Dasania marina]|uniref:alpha/beta fold hydrolase n=1 Tax=Dasania marina TaxID=471499 RepID=UPI0030DA58B1